MNSEALLALIADLYAQVATQTAQIEALAQENARLRSDTSGTPQN